MTVATEVFELLQAPPPDVVLFSVTAWFWQTLAGSVVIALSGLSVTVYVETQPEDESVYLMGIATGPVSAVVVAPASRPVLELREA